MQLFLLTPFPAGPAVASQNKQLPSAVSWRLGSLPLPKRAGKGMAEPRTCREFPELHLHILPGSGFLSALSIRRGVNLAATNPSSPILPRIPRCQVPAQPQGSILPSVYLHTAMAGVNQALNPLQISCHINSNFGSGSSHILSRAEPLGSRHLPVV